MFEQTEYRVLPGWGAPSDLPARVGHVTGSALAQVGPTAWAGRSLARSWNITQTITVQTMPAPGGTGVQITTGAEVDQTGMVLFIVAAVLLWPVAVIVGFLAYDDFNKRRQYALQMIWSQLGAPMAPMAPTQPGPYGVRP
jgi:hypothetical protein